MLLPRTCPSCTTVVPKRRSAKAAENGHLECLRYAHEHGAPWGDYTCSSAAVNGHLECLRYAHEHGAPWGNYTCSSAAGNGHLECLQYAHEHGAPWNSYTCTWAAGNGHLECVRYAHEHGAPWGNYTCSSAARYGHLECLRYAHEHGAPWDADTCSSAARDGHLECLSYAHEHGAPMHEPHLTSSVLCTEYVVKVLGIKAYASNVRKQTPNIEVELDDFTKCFLKVLRRRRLAATAVRRWRRLVRTRLHWHVAWVLAHTTIIPIGLASSLATLACKSQRH